MRKDTQKKGDRKLLIYFLWPECGEDLAFSCFWGGIIKKSTGFCDPML